MGLLSHNNGDGPRLTSVHPPAALPGSLVEVRGEHLGAKNDADRKPFALFDEEPSYLALSRADRALVHVPEASGVAPALRIMRSGEQSNSLPVSIASPLIEDIHPVGSPAIDREGNVYVMNSGPRGEQVDVSVYRVGRDFQVRPFLRDLMNISGLAWGPDNHLYASSRANGTVYRISADGAVRMYAEGMGVATGLAFDRAGSLYVGDRAGTIFKIAPNPDDLAVSGETFVFATLEPSVAAYHLAFREDGRLLVSAPTTESHGSIHAIAPDGTTTSFYRGLGRPQGLAVDAAGQVYVAASYRGKHGLIRIDESGRTELVIAGDSLVGVCFAQDGALALTTKSALFHLPFDVEGRAL